MRDEQFGGSDFPVNIDESISPLQAARIALAQEIKARIFYERCAQVVVHPGAKKMFQFLAAEERKHQDFIEQEIEESFLKEM